MKVKFVKHPPNDYLPPKIKGESILYELSTISPSEPPNSKYWLRCHECGVSANLADHQVSIIHGIITISPSIQCPNCPAHYYIKNSEIQ